MKNRGKKGKKAQSKGASQEMEREVCTSAFSPEHARLDNPDLPCDDSRGGGA